jgi:sec-independent protein translocase protein TatB
VFNLQGSEIVVILLLALVILGPEKLPDAIRKFTQTYAELKKMGSGFQSELKNALDEPMREMRETGERLRDAVDPSRYVVTPPGEVAEPMVAEPVTEPVVEPAPDVVPDADVPVADVPAADMPDEAPGDPGSTTVATPGDPPTR